jgi:hypothetical protein
MSDSKAKEILMKGEYGLLSTVSSEGEPYGVPLNYAYFGDAIYFHCAKEGHKLRNMETNNKVSFCVVARTEVVPVKFTSKYESVIAFGEAWEITGDEKRRGLLEIVEKYSPDFVREGEALIEKVGEKTRVYKIMIREITGKENK